MNERATGLIVRTRQLTESSLIVHWLTPGFGRIATVAKGARRPKSPFLGKLDFAFLADFSFQRSRRSELHTLREVAVREFHPFLRRNLDYLSQVAHAFALIELTTEPETPLPEIFELVFGFIGALPTQPASPNSVFAFEIKLLEHLGLDPRPELAGLSPETRGWLGQLARPGWPESLDLNLAPSDSAELGRRLQRFLLFHFHRVPRSRPAAVGF